MYGLEEIVDGRVQVDPRLAAAQPAVAAAARDLAADPAVAASGAHLEDKRYAVAVHTRRVADPERWAAPIDQAAARVAARHGLEVVPGRMVWELRPQVRSDKGDAVRRVAAESGAGALVVVGDDLGDLPAFAVAAELGGGLRVAVRSAEAPPELLDAADLVRRRPGRRPGAPRAPAHLTVRIESSVTAVSWVPLDCVEGGQRLQFHVGAAQYDDPPPDHLDDLPGLLAAGRVRLANQLRGFVEVDGGRVVAHGQSGHGHVGAPGHPTPARVRVRVRGARGGRSPPRSWGSRRWPCPTCGPNRRWGTAGCGSGRPPGGCCRWACPTSPTPAARRGWPPRPPGPPWP